MAALVRRSLDGKETILCLINVTPEARQLSLGLDHGLPATSAWRDLIGGQGYTAMHSGLHIDLKPYQSYWLSIDYT